MRTSLLAIAVLLSQAAFGEAGDGFSQRTLEQVYARISPAIGLLEFSTRVTKTASGETVERSSNAIGLIVSADGLVMTHGHMVLDNVAPFNITLKVGQGEEEQAYPVTLLRKPEDVNAVFLRVQSDEPLDLPHVQFAKEDGLKIGSAVALFGILGDTLDNTRGLMTARVGTILETPRLTYCLDQGVRFGFVNGPVVDTAGRVVGVVGFDMSAAEGGDLYVRSRHPLIYQASLFRKYIENPPGANETRHERDDAFLGVFTQPLTDDLAEYWDLEPKGGLVISTVVAGSPADKAGLRPGDVIAGFDGSPIRAKQDRDVRGFTKLVREHGPGKPVAMDVLRKGKAVRVELTLGARPRTFGDAAEFEDELFGLTVREITTDIRIQMNLQEDVRGVIVSRVRPGGPAHLAKIAPHVIVMALGDHRVGGIDEYKKAAEQLAEQRPREVVIFARWQSRTGFFRMTPRWPESE